MVHEKYTENIIWQDSRGGDWGLASAFTTRKNCWGVYCNGMWNNNVITTNKNYKLLKVSKCSFRTLICEKKTVHRYIIYFGVTAVLIECQRNNSFEIVIKKKKLIELPLKQKKLVPRGRNRKTRTVTWRVRAIRNANELIKNTYCRYKILDLTRKIIILLLS